jgi:2-pyrone-4,6-dicarboxylate lactonase
MKRLTTEDPNRLVKSQAPTTADALLSRMSGLAAPFQSLLKLISSPHCWVKLSGADRLAKQGALEATVAFARSLIDAAPDRVLWGTDWPHVNLERSHDDEALFGLLAEIAPDDPSLKRLLVDNPARLYGF